ncbi:bacteriodes thetaiotaomicron symbiotic chitinase [Aspergillus affinis]|uniref:bacteriodes thetaiotaomicron symbiotic chitinase n=1 Tax=Aspergillus affinis TaxID=1070780 RepID=UPI0022FE092F|nr:bacteriodes thetaiotaomicron symbiotic chitinase [Aspergillus affinis]KAI9043450.1 bacteriodes thetaiotaomicron symbiotic chitinase [Aspergillus affinis]
MAYDIHGTWDGTSKWTSSVVNPHTNLTVFDGMVRFSHRVAPAYFLVRFGGLDLLWRNDIDPKKILLGLGFYGRSFTLDDSACTSPGCDFYTKNDNTGGAAPGTCTGTSGFLSDYEISRSIKSFSPNIHYDQAAGVNWMTWSGNQWVSFDDGRTLKQKADFANSRCLGGLFSWALDLGGQGSLKNPNELTAGDTSMDGANAKEGSDGTGILYVGQEVLGNSPTFTAIAPVSIIFPKSVLNSPTTINLRDGYPTSLEVAWSTPKTVTIGIVTTVTSTITRHIMSTTNPLKHITTATINYYNWKISDVVTSSIGTLIPSIEIALVVVIDDPNPLRDRRDSFAPCDSHLTFKEGSPPGPTCTANCGHKCYGFCNGPCLHDCGAGSSSSFIDPLDKNPPSFSKCSGPGCINGRCTGDSLCIERGCTGADCKNRICVGDNCIPTAYTGKDCDEGHCSGKDCQDHGCISKDCNGKNDKDDDDDNDDSGGGGGGGGGVSGLRLGRSCFSWGCLGPACSKTDFTCTGSRCRIVTCSGRDCSNGVCTGKGCQSEDSECEGKEADSCTAYISSTLIKPASTYSTTNVASRCQTITACAATPTTTTRTVDKDGLVEGTISNTGISVADSTLLSSQVLDDISSFFEAVFTITEVTTTSKPTTTKKTTSAPPVPTETGCNCDLPGAKRDNCEMTGKQMAAAYDHIFQETGGGCKVCGRALFEDGCLLHVDYVTTCKTTNSLLEVFIGNGSDISSSSEVASSSLLQL